MPEKALDVHEKMSVNSNEVTHLIVFSACAALANERAKTLGKKLLKQMPRSFLEHDHLITAAVDMLMKFGDVAGADHLFNGLKRKSGQSYGALMKGNSHNVHSLCVEADRVFQDTSPITCQRKHWMCMKRCLSNRTK